MTTAARQRQAPSGRFLPEASTPGVYFVDDFGAVQLPQGSDRDQPAVALRTANTAAWNKAIAFIVAQGGGTLLIGAGIYLTNGPSGLFLTGDLNVNLIIQGVAGFSLIQSNDYTAPCLGFHTHGSNNLRNITINDLVIRGGREGLSLVWVAYSTFNRVWAWGSKNFAIQNEVGNGNNFNDCKLNESAQGIGDGTEADAVLFVSCNDTLVNCDFGEFCGGVVLNGGLSKLDGGDFFDCEYRGRPYFSYIDGVTVDISPFLAFTASVILWQGAAVLSAIYGTFRKRFLTCFRSYDVVVSGRVQTDTGVTPFEGFIDVVTEGGTPLALNVQEFTAVYLGGNSGYFIADDDDVLHDALIDAQVEFYAGSTVTPLSESAPALLNPNFQGNILQLAVFNRFTPRDVPQVSAWLRFTYGTITGSGWSSVPDEVVGNPAVQSADARRPVNGLSPDGLPTATFSDASSTSLSWPLNADNNQTSKTGFACWVKQPASSGPDRIISIGGGTGGASGQKLFLAFDSSQRVTVGLYSSDAGGRQGITGAAAFTADTWIFLRLAFDGTQATEALRCKIYINEVLQTLTFSDIGAGGAVTVLHTVTGNALLGNFNDSIVSLQGLNGSIGPNFYCIAGDIFAQDGQSLMGFQPPVAMGVLAAA